MGIMKPSERTAALVEEVLMNLPCAKKKMFGCSAYFVDGKMFAGVHGSSVFMRLSPEDRFDLLASVAGAGPFEPMEGRIMREYISLRDEAISAPLLEKWLGRSYLFVRSLPPKEQKTSRRKAK